MRIKINENEEYVINFPEVVGLDEMSVIIDRLTWLVKANMKKLVVESAFQNIAKPSDGQGIPQTTSGLLGQSQNNPRANLGLNRKGRPRKYIRHERRKIMDFEEAKKVLQLYFLDKQKFCEYCRFDIDETAIYPYLDRLKNEFNLWDYAKQLKQEAKVLKFTQQHPATQ